MRAFPPGRTACALVNRRYIIREYAQKSSNITTPGTPEHAETIALDKLISSDIPRYEPKNSQGTAS